MKILKRMNKLINVDILLTILLAILITCELKVEEDIRQFMNSVFGLVSCSLLVVLMFMYLNPLVAILFLVYFYENVRFDNLQSGLYDKYTNKNALNLMSNTLKINQKKQDVVEIDTINRMAPIIKKREKNISFKPYSYQNETFKLLK